MDGATVVAGDPLVGPFAVGRDTCTMRIGCAVDTMGSPASITMEVSPEGGTPVTIKVVDVISVNTMHISDIPAVMRDENGRRITYSLQADVDLKVTYLVVDAVV